MPLNSDQASALVITERISSVLSLLGLAFIIATYVCDSGFRRPINRLVFYASWGNVVTNVATLISRSGFHFGGAAPLCQLQAFIIQWYVRSDTNSFATLS
jgi:hypothetical protein